MPTVREHAPWEWRAAPRDTQLPPQQSSVPRPPHPPSPPWLLPAPSGSFRCQASIPGRNVLQVICGGVPLLAWLLRGFCVSAWLGSDFSRTASAPRFWAELCPLPSPHPAPHNSYVETLSLSMSQGDYLETFTEVIKVRRGPASVLRGRGIWGAWGDPQRGAATREHREKTAAHKPTAPPEIPSVPTPLLLDSGLQSCEETDFCCGSGPGWGVLFWRPEQRGTPPRWRRACPSVPVTTTAPSRVPGTPRPAGGSGSVLGAVRIAARRPGVGWEWQAQLVPSSVHW